MIGLEFRTMRRDVRMVMLPEMTVLNITVVKNLENINSSMYVSQ